MKIKNILLVIPERMEYAEVVKLPFIKAKAFMAPLQMATIAALTPDGIEVDIWDELVRGRIGEDTDLDKNYDLVGITGYVVDLPRTKAIAQIFRRRGITVVIGGPGVSSAPERCRDNFDVCFIGEAEETWPEFIADWQAGSYRAEYRQVIPPNLSASPVPRWDILGDHIKSYITGAIQTTRGCPFDCEFCDVIYLFGRRPRHKPIASVLDEIIVQERLGVETVFICDDNFIGSHQYAKDLLRELIPLNNSFEKPLQFFTQLSIDVAKDDELLELLADANFSTLCIGIESVNKDSLKEANKFQNYRVDLVEACKKIQSYGMAIRGGMVVGFDHDDPTVFDKQFEFSQEACIPMLRISILKAAAGTRLWARLLKEGRLLQNDLGSYVVNPLASTNIIPGKMTRMELLTGFRELQKQLQDWDNFAARVKGFVSGVSRPPAVSQKAPPEELFSEVMNFLFSVDKKTRETMMDIFRYTREHAPFMLGKVVKLTMMQYSEVAFPNPSSPEEIDRLIEIEKGIDIPSLIDRRELAIPESFYAKYKELFPEIYQRVHSVLKDREDTSEALVEVFTDFLTHWGGNFEQTGDHHRAFLLSLADRAAMKWKRYQGGNSRAQEINESELADTILKAVEQNLRGILSMGMIGSTTVSIPAGLTPALNY